MRRVRALVGFFALTASWTGLAQADGEGGTRRLNPILSSFFWSPAQFYDVSSTEVHGGLAHLDLKSSTEGDGFEVDVDASGQAFVLMGLARVPETPVVAGLSIDQTKVDGKVKTKLSSSFGEGTGDEKIESTSMTIEPTFAFAVNDYVSAGFTYAIVDSETEPEEGDGASFSYTVFKPGVAYHDGKSEVGIVYSPTINMQEDGYTEQHAGGILLHASYLATPDLRVGGTLESLQTKVLDDDQLKDSYRVRLAMEQMVGPKALLGFTGIYTSESADGKEYRDPSNISEMGFTAYGEYMANAQSSLGLGVAHERTGKQSGEIELVDEVEETDLEMTTTVIFLTANYRK